MAHAQPILAAAKTTNKSVTEASGFMTRMTGAMNRTLSGIGINIERDGSLSVNEEAFKKADMDTVRSLFGQGGAFVKTVASSAARLQTATSQQQLFQEMSYSTAYGRYGSYMNNYINGSLYNNLF